MPNATPLTDAINTLTTYANETTGASDTDLSSAVATLVAGYGSGGGSSITLPSGYTLVDYIESSGTQYIDTGLYTTSTQQYYIKYKPSSTTATTNVFGNNLSTGCACFIQNVSSGVYYRYGSTSYAFINKMLPAIDISYSVMLDINGFYCEDIVTGEYATVATISSSTVTEDSSIHNILFGRSTSSSARQLGSLKIYYFKVVDDGTTIMEMYPCRRDSDNVLGMYDVINDEFYTNDGSGSFTGGTI